MARESLAQYLADLQVEISSRETNLVYGIVESKEPVKINYNGITLEGEFLLVDESANIKVGERVPLLKTNRSQKFILLRFGEDELDWDELVSIPETATRWPSWSEVTSKPSLFSTRWDLVSNKPTTFKPESHTHPWAEVTGKPETFPPSTHSHTWESITSKPTTFPPSTHTHDWSSITDKPTTFTPSTHTHTIANIANLQAELNGKASTSHTHSWDTITGKPTSFPVEAHTHSEYLSTTGGVVGGNLRVNGRVGINRAPSTTSIIAIDGDAYVSGDVQIGTVFVRSRIESIESNVTLARTDISNLDGINYTPVYYNGASGDNAQFVKRGQVIYLRGAIVMGATTTGGHTACALPTAIRDGIAKTVIAMNADTGDIRRVFITTSGIFTFYNVKAGEKYVIAPFIQNY